MKKKVKKYTEHELDVIMLKIIDDWKKDGIVFNIQNQEVAYCYVPEKEIWLNAESYFHPTVKTVFDMLHEYGHIKTNTPKMNRCEEEFYATQWAIDNCSRYGLEISAGLVDIFQVYIWSWRDKDSKKKKNVPTKKKLTLVWED